MTAASTDSAGHGGQRKSGSSSDKRWQQRTGSISALRIFMAWRSGISSSSMAAAAAGGRRAWRHGRWHGIWQRAGREWRRAAAAAAAARAKCWQQAKWRGGMKPEGSIIGRQHGSRQRKSGQPWRSGINNGSSSRQQQQRAAAGGSISSSGRQSGVTWHGGGSGWLYGGMAGGALASAWGLAQPGVMTVAAMAGRRIERAAMAKSS